MCADRGAADTRGGRASWDPAHGARVRARRSALVRLVLLLTLRLLPIRIPLERLQPLLGIPPRLRILGLAVLQVLLERLLGLLGLLVLRVENAKVVVRARVPGVARDGLLVLLDGVVGVALAPIHGRQAEVVLRLLGAQRDRLAEGGDRPLHVARLLLGDAQAVPGVGVLGLDL